MTLQRILLTEGGDWPPHYQPDVRDKKTYLMWCKWDGTPLTEEQLAQVQRLTASAEEITRLRLLVERLSHEPDDSQQGSAGR